MGVMGLAFPTDIRWERICHTEDMNDPTPCDNGSPPKWQTSIAVFRYVPGAEYQTATDRRLSYLKITCTIGSYQPRSDEVQLAIDPASLSVGEVAELEKKLSSYLACNGAILLVTLTPREKGVAFANYPYVADVQPKQRALYEQVTDTGEVASRSLETLNVRKGGGTTESQEVMDIDKGFAVGGSVEAEGVGVGGTYSRSGEWGTKNLGQQDRSRIETTDATRESREVRSHTTQLTQMYTLLQAYHIGTNRVIFYVSPRPHVVEEPSGFIRGPRQIDGVQEFFLVVDQPADQELPCVSVRLDTAHLTIVDEFDYDRSPEPRTLSVDITAPAPAENGGAKVSSDNILYDCFISPTISDDDSCNAPSGYVIDTWEDVVPKQVVSGTTEVIQSADNRTVTLTGSASGRGCYRNGAGDTANAAALVTAGTVVNPGIGTLVGALIAASGADVFDENGTITTGRARHTIRVVFRSEMPTKKVGEHQALILTSRLLCCCETEESVPPKIVDIRLVDVVTSHIDPDVLVGHGPDIVGGKADAIDVSGGLGPEKGAALGSGGIRRAGALAKARFGISAKEANLLQERIATEMASAASKIGNVGERPALDGVLAMTRVTEFALSVPRLRRALGRPLEELKVDPSIAQRLKAAALPSSPRGHAATRMAILATAPAEFVKVSKLEASEALALQLAVIGLGKAPGSGGGEKKSTAAPKRRGAKRKSHG